MSDLRTLLQESESGHASPLEFQLLFSRARRRTARRRIAAVGSAGGLLVAVLLAVAFLREGTSLKIDVIQPADPTTEEVPGSVFEVGSSESRPQGGAGPASSAGGAPARSARAEGTDTRGQAATVAGEKARIPVRAGTYSYEVSGIYCSSTGRYACDDAESLSVTYDQPIASHQRESGKLRWRRGGRYDYDTSHDYRPDGVYWEHYSETTVNSWGIPAAYTCPELEAEPVRVWKTGAKPGDHFELYSGLCDGAYPDDPEGSTRITLDIIRAETISIGGQEVLTFFVRRQSYKHGEPTAMMESWVLTDAYLFVKSYEKWKGDYPGGSTWGELWTELKSLTPS